MGSTGLKCFCSSSLPPSPMNDTARQRAVGRKILEPMRLSLRKLRHIAFSGCDRLPDLDAGVLQAITGHHAHLFCRHGFRQFGDRDVRKILPARVGDDEKRHFRVLLRKLHVPTGRQIQREILVLDLLGTNGDGQQQYGQQAAAADGKKFLHSHHFDSL